MRSIRGKRGCNEDVGAARYGSRDNAADAEGHIVQMRGDGQESTGLGNARRHLLTSS